MLKPKVATPDFAVRVTEDIIAEPGQWLLVFGEVVKVMDHIEVMDRYDLLDPATPTLAPAPAPTPLLLASPDAHVLTGKSLQILLALKRAGGRDRRSGDLRRYLDGTLHKQISQKLTVAYEAGLVSRRVPEEVARGYLWSLTDKGWHQLEALSTP